MSLKSFFVLFSQKSKKAPVIYKTLATIQKHMSQNPDLDYKTFQSQLEANQFIKAHKNNIISTPRPTLIPTPPNVDIKNNINTIHRQQIKPIQSPTNTQPKSQYQTIKEVDKAYKNKIQLIKKHAFFKNFTPAPLLRENIPTKVNLFFDGSSRLNPGPAAIGYICKSDDNRTFFKRGWGIGYKTNNEAEFCALSWGLLDCVLKGVFEVNVFGDSQLVLNAMTEAYTLKKFHLVEYQKITKQIQKLLLKVNYQHIDRSFNSQADMLARKVTDAAMKRFNM